MEIMSQPYLVSARKYRPQTFESVVGQAHITTTLKNAIRNNQIAHAYLFFGPRGVGKTTCARILAKTINCTNPTPDLEACGQCDTCLAFEQNANMNIFELDAASNNSVDDIRSLTEQVRFAPQQGKYKIYIIDEVHMLSTSAFNAFLKTLEEPPHYAIFILATTEKHKVLPTILSRCQIFDFKRIQIKDIAEHLARICEKENIKYDMNALHIIAQKAEGGMRDALSIMDRIASFSNQNINYDSVIEHLNILDASVYFEWTEAFLRQDYAHALIILDKHLQLGFEGDMIIEGLAEHFRNLLLSKDERLLQLIDLPEEFKSQYYQQANIIEETFIINALSILNKTELDYKITLNKKLLLEVTLIKLAHLNQFSQIPSPELDSVKKKHDKIAINQLENKNNNTGNASDENIISEVEEQNLQTKPKEEVKKESTAPPSLKLNQEQNALKKLHKENKPQVASTPPSLQLKKKRTSLQDMHQQVANSLDEEIEVEINLELVHKYFDEYRESLKPFPEKHPMLTQLEHVDIVLESKDLIRFMCHSTINLSYAEKAAEEFREFIREKTQNKIIRVLAQLDPDSKKEIVIEKPISKLDIFHEMVADFPHIAVLKSKYKFDVE